MPTRTAPTRAPQGLTAASRARRSSTPPQRPAHPGPRPRFNVFGPLSIAVGVVALGLGVIPLAGFFTWPLAIVGAVLGIVGATRLLRRHGPSIVGIALGGLALVVGLAVSVGSIQSLESTSAAAGSSGVGAAVLQLAPTPTPSAALQSVGTKTPSIARITSDPSGSRYGGYPASEAAFVHVFQHADAKVARTAKAAKRASLVGKRDANACRVLSKNRVTDWVGRVHDVGADEDGNGWVNIEIASTVVVQTWNNALSDHGDGTLVKRSSPFYRTLTGLGQGATVRFSGTLLSSSTSCLEQQNLTARMYGVDPNVIIRLDALTQR